MRELHRVIGHSSEVGIRRAADRLVAQGIVRRRSAGRSHLYRLNRAHVAAGWIEGLASLPEQLLAQLRQRIGTWEQPPVTLEPVIEDVLREGIELYGSLRTLRQLAKARTDG